MDLAELVVSYLPLYEIYLCQEESVAWYPLFVRETKSRLHKGSLEPLEVAYTVDSEPLFDYYLYAVNNLFLPHTPKLTLAELLILAFNHDCPKIALRLMKFKFRSEDQNLIEEHTNWNKELFYYATPRFSRALKRFLKNNGIDDSDTMEFDDSHYWSRYSSLTTFHDYLQGLTKPWFVDSLVTLYPESLASILTDIKRQACGYPGSIVVLLEALFNKDLEIVEWALEDKSIPDALLFPALDQLRTKESVEESIDELLDALKIYRLAFFNYPTFFIRRYTNPVTSLWSFLDKVISALRYLPAIPYDTLVDYTLLAGDEDSYNRLLYYRVDRKEL